MLQLGDAIETQDAPMNSFTENILGTLISAPPLDFISRFNV